MFLFAALLREECVVAVFVTRMVDRFEKWREVRVRRRARRKGQVPALPLIEEDGTTRFVRFDDYIDGVMIDRKMSVNRAAKFRHQAMREHRVLTQIGRTARWEVPSERVRKRAEDVLRTLDIDTITVEVAS